MNQSNLILRILQIFLSLSIIDLIALNGYTLTTLNSKLPTQPTARVR